jgi:myo-inositol-1-phosphate synthase
MNDWPEDEAFRLSDAETVDIIKVLKETQPDVLINYCPVGSQKATEFYVNAALELGIPFLNCIPVFIASDPKWEQKFIEKKLPIIGDDMRSQVGASIISAVLQELFLERGHTIDVHVQQNTGGNTDFLNMTDQSRLKSKKISKTNVISSQSELQGYVDKPNSIHAGPSEYVRFFKDQKVAHFHIEAKGFGNSPVVFDARLSVIDSPNSAGVVIDAIRFLKVAHEMKMCGSIDGPSAFTQKTPKIQMKTSDAYKECLALSKRELTEITKRNLR